MLKKILKISSITILTFMLLGFAFLFGTNLGYQLRVVAAEIIMSSQHRGLVKLTFLPQEEVDSILKSIQNPEVENTHDSSLNWDILQSIQSQEQGKKTSTQELIDIFERRQAERGITQAMENNDLALAEEIKKEYETKISSNQNSKLVVSVEDIEGTYSDHFFKGKMATISNPFNVGLELSSGKQISSEYGEQLNFIAQTNNGILATNASGFVDENGVGNGGTPIGIVINDGQHIADPGGTFAKANVAGITNEGLLISGDYSTDELLALGVQEAAGFKPQLISNGEKIPMEGNGGWGYGPRTAIGQKADGSIVLVVIDGRQTHSVGASIIDLQEIMYNAGVVNAMTMDGGSSALMYFNGKNITTPSSVKNIPRYIPNAWVVKAKTGQEVEIYENGQLINSYTQ